MPFGRPSLILSDRSVRVVQGEGDAPKRYLVITTETPAEPGEPIQVQTQP